ncbi:hypothetical protein GQ54DRAFT_306678 [Martensiomyces pterosporus]|nr:hypothetical protein GQ54DRAFT_306678 [Martensiomyces pterosporus]
MVLLDELPLDILLAVVKWLCRRDLVFESPVVYNRNGKLFAPTLVDLTLYCVNPENVWNIFYDGQEGETVVFARLKRLVIRFENPLRWGQNSDLPPHWQGATRGMLTRRSVWTARATGGKPGCRVPLFPVLCTLACTDMVYNLHDFISRTQCHNSLVSLYVNSRCTHFDFDINLFKNLEAVEFNISFPDTNEERTGYANLCESAFTSLLRAKTNLQRMAFRSFARDALFQMPPDIGCVNLQSLCLGVGVDFKSMLQLLSSLKHLIELELYVNYGDMHNDNGEQENGAGYIDELQPSQAEYPPVSSTLRRFTCRLRSPRVRRCYTASYAFELALHLPKLETMTLGVDEEDGGFYEVLLGRPQQQPPPHAWTVVLLQSTLNTGRNQDKHKLQNMESLQKFTTDNYGYIPLAKDTAQASLELKYRGDIAQHTRNFGYNFSLMGTSCNDVFVTNAYVHALPAHICRQLARKGLYHKLSDTIRDATIEEHFDWTQPTVSGSEEM